MYGPRTMGTGRGEGRWVASPPGRPSLAELREPRYSIELTTGKSLGYIYLYEERNVYDRV